MKELYLENARDAFALCYLYAGPVRQALPLLRSALEDALYLDKRREKALSGREGFLWAVQEACNEFYEKDPFGRKKYKKHKKDTGDSVTLPFFLTDPLRAILRLLVAQGCLVQTQGQYPVLQLGEKAGEVLRGQQKLFLRRKRSAGERGAAEPLRGTEADEVLLERLKAVRGRLARMGGVPAYVVFSDKTLREMSTAKPNTPAQLRQISGVVEYKQSQYGEAFLACIRQYVQEQAGRQ